MCASTLPLSRGNLWARRDGYDAKKNDKALIKKRTQAFTPAKRTMQITNLRLFA
jgi:hypothetical protein